MEGNIDKGKWEEKITGYIPSLERTRRIYREVAVMEMVYRFNVQQAPNVLSQRHSRLKQKGRTLVWCVWLCVGKICL